MSLSQIQEISLMNNNGTDMYKYTRIYDDNSYERVYSDNYIPAICSSCNKNGCFCLPGIKTIISDAFEHLNNHESDEIDFNEQLFRIFEDLEMLEILEIQDMKSRKLQVDMILTSIAQLPLQGQLKISFSENTTLSMTYDKSEKDYYRYRLNCLICLCVGETQSASKKSNIMK